MELEQLYNNGTRAVRFTAGAVKDEVLSFCDAKGVYVAITAPINSSKAGESRKLGGNPSNNPKWRKEYVDRTTQMIHTTKRHPSVVAYYLADDSSNGICLYESYLAAKAITDIPVFYDDGGKEWNSDNREFR
jgi:beta-galactosidase